MGRTQYNLSGYNRKDAKFSGAEEADSRWLLLYFFSIQQLSLGPTTSLSLPSRVYLLCL